jgi:serine/threonine-protein kinase
VLLDEDQKPILADFGLARMLEASIRLTQASQALGTPEFMSPEQAMGGDPDQRSDIYAFGVMLYQMLVGRTPFRADTPAATLMAHVHRPVPLPSLLNADIESGIEAIILKALAKDPNDRFDTSRAIISGLRVVSGEAGSAGLDELVTEEMDPVDLGTTLGEDAHTERLEPLLGSRPSARQAPPAPRASAREPAATKVPTPGCGSPS